MCPSSRQGQILPLFLQPWLALSRRKITQQRSTAAVINPDVSLAALMTTGVNARAHNSLGNASRFISLLRLPSTLIIWVLLSLQGSYAPHALPNNPLVATPPRAHIVCNLSHCSVHVHTTIFDPSSSLSLRVRVRFTFSITEPVTCASTRYIYIYIVGFLFFHSIFRFFSTVSRVVTLATDPIHRPAGELIATRESYDARYRVRYKVVLYITLMPSASILPLKPMPSLSLIYI